MIWKKPQYELDLKGGFRRRRFVVIYAEGGISNVIKGKIKEDCLVEQVIEADNNSEAVLQCAEELVANNRQHASWLNYFKEYSDNDSLKYILRELQLRVNIYIESCTEIFPEKNQKSKILNQIYQ